MIDETTANLVAFQNFHKAMDLLAAHNLRLEDVQCYVGEYGTGFGRKYIAFVHLPSRSGLGFQIHTEPDTEERLTQMWAYYLFEFVRQID